MRRRPAEIAHLARRPRSVNRGGTGLARGALAGAAAGAAGTTALNTITYLDMTARGRPTSTAPEDTVEKLSEKSRVPIPGRGERRRNRVAGLGPLSGVLAGVGIGVLLGLGRAAGWRPGMILTGSAATAAALIGTNGPMTVLGVTKPLTWSVGAWLTDVVPHLGYGAVTAVLINELDP